MILDFGLGYSVVCDSGLMLCQHIASYANIAGSIRHRRIFEILALRSSTELNPKSWLHHEVEAGTLIAKGIRNCSPAKHAYG